MRVPPISSAMRVPPLSLGMRIPPIEVPPMSFFNESSSYESFSHRFLL
jgi:hypothetical protein